MNKIFIEQFSNDIWDLEKLNIAESRQNKANKRKTLRFDYCINEDNKRLVKLYVVNQLGNTSLTISTINTNLSRIKNFINFLGDKSLVEVDRNTILEYYQELNQVQREVKSYNDFIYKNRDFMLYLEVKGHVEKTHFYMEDAKNAPRKHVLKKVPQDIINQIFMILDKIPSMFSLMYLILYSTGMRVSEMCQIEIGKTHSLDDGYFLEYYNVKMKKNVTNPISESLFLLIRSREDELLKTSDNKEVYLFPRMLMTPYNSNTFREQFNNYIEPFNIKTNDGNVYRFKPHDYRHTIASTMAKNDVPLHIIQSILHHESQQMTMAYIDKDSSERIEQYKDFVNNKGLKAEINMETAKLEWLRENINAQILPNGACSLPVKLGKCPNGNACLTCDSFLTSKKFLNVHKRQLVKTNELIEVSKANNWIHQVETNILIRDNLERIITSLEKEG